MDSEEPASLYKSSEPYLTTRDFASLRRHVTASPHSNSLPATQLLTLTHILSQTRPDHYSILSLPRYTSDPTRIRTQFKSLALLLNPNTNPVPLSSQAYAILLEAYSVLSNPDKKLYYDNFLRISAEDKKGKPAFWTVCPYCYYVYEYEREYLDCCLKCRNEGCGRGFTAVEVGKPPDEVAGSGRYLCLGFDGIGFNGFSTWSPFEGGGEKMGFKRRKTVGVCSNKVTGKGVRVSAEEMERIVAGV